MAKHQSDDKNLTIEDVAHAAGVSTMTVSRVLRNTGTVSISTKSRVEASIKELGYVHNRLAGSLANAHSAQIAVIIPTLKSTIFTEVLAGIAETLNGTGYQPVVGISEYDQQREFEIVKSMMEWRPAGFILASIRHLDETHRILESSSAPIVEVMELTKKPIDLCVGLDQWDAGKAMAQHLLKKGYRRFAYLGVSHRFDQAAGRRYDAFNRTLKSQGLSFVASLTLAEPLGVGIGKTHLPALLAKCPDIEIVYFSNDAVAAGAMLYCIENKINVPADLAIASFSGLEIGRVMPVRITTVLSPRHKMGCLSAARVLTRLRGGYPQKITDAGFELIEGGSA